jgi:DNA helicase HerA-like ATPase
MKKTILIVLFVLVPSLHAADCEMKAILQQEVDLQQTNYEQHLILQQEILRAREIQNQLVDSESGREILLLAERFEEELNDHRSNRNTSVGLAGASLGSIVVASYFINRLAQSSQGLAFKERLMIQLRPKGDRVIVRTLLNTTVFVAVVSTLWSTYQIQQHENEVQKLALLIDKINSLWDLSGSIAQIREHLEELEVQLELLDCRS